MSKRIIGEPVEGESSDFRSSLEVIADQFRPRVSGGEYFCNGSKHTPKEMVPAAARVVVIENGSSQTGAPEGRLNVFVCRECVPEVKRRAYSFLGVRIGE